MSIRKLSAAIYAALPQSPSRSDVSESETTGFLHPEDKLEALTLKQLREGTSKQRRRCTSAIVTIIAILFATCVLLAIAYSSKSVSDQVCDQQLSIWSPLNEIVEYEEYDFENPFAHDTIYRGPPTPDLEKAWEKLWFYGGVRIPEDKLPFLNRTADMGGGRILKPVEDDQGGYHSLFEVFHQLHCLNLIRQYTWRDWYFRHPDVVETPPDMRADDVGARMHVDHCIEALRISLMCHSDTTPYLIMLDPTAPQGTRADFSPHHKCRKFEPIRQWVKDNQLSFPSVHPHEEDLKFPHHD